ncbi:MAG: alpha-amylase [Kytococcus sp.]|nr:alpha-amylase [Kytococcus sp.]
MNDPSTKAGGTPFALHEIHAANPAGSPWWRDAVIYQIYPRSWADGDGDGVGDLPGIASRLEHLRDLGVDAVWLSPFYRSPQRDAGYDVADHRDVDPLFGTLDDADAMIARAHELGLRVVVDLVPNHTSSDHAWFREALAAGPGSPERARYVFRDGLGEDGSLPPTNWLANFGGGAWTRVLEADGTPGQWYLHLFDPSQPDLDWTNPQVRADFETTLRFWLDRGVDGFRVDVAHGLVKDPAFPPFGKHPGGLMEVTHEAPYWDQDGVHEIYRSWRALLDSYGAPERILCAEAWVAPADRLARYVRPDEMHQAFNFDFLETQWHAGALREAVRRSLAANDSVGAPSTWVLSNHDVLRHASRFGLPVGQPRPNGIGAADPQPDAELGVRRARAATALMLALPGGAYVYQGEELGLPEHTSLPDEVRQDPTFARTGGVELGRDGCRVPMPWTKGAPALGFNDTGASWLPQPASYSELAVDAQTGVAGSTLELYRTLLALRRDRRLGLGGLAEVEGLPEEVLGYVSTAPDGTRTLVLVNLSGAPVDLPDGAEVLVSSADLGDTRVPGDVTVWASLR